MPEQSKIDSYTCPVCDQKDLPANQLFLKQNPGKKGLIPIACIGCIRGLYWSLPNINNQMLSVHLQK